MASNLMSGVQLALAIGFWVCAALVVYAYVGYPVLVWGLARWVGKTPRLPGEAPLPSLSLLIAAYNEEQVIEERLRNALAMDYPADRFEVVVGSDGSTDGTARIVGRYAGQGVRLLEYGQRRGKASVLNDSWPQLRGQIVLLSDANTELEAGAGRRLAQWFSNERIGAVVGRLVLRDPRTGRNVDSYYWRYETFLKKCESRLGALLGANGAIYAMRREAYVPIPAGTIVDDFVIPLRATLQSGCAIVYDARAIAWEETPAGVGSEFRRRVRIGAGGFQAIVMLWRLLDARRGWIAFTFLSHKVLRWLCPFFLIGMLISSACLWGVAWYRYAWLAQLSVLAVSTVAGLAPARLRLFKPLRLVTMFTTMNLALLVGFGRWVRGGQTGVWQRTARAVGGPADAEAAPPASRDDSRPLPYA